MIPPARKIFLSHRVRSGRLRIVITDRGYRRTTKIRANSTSGQRYDHRCRRHQNHDAPSQSPLRCNAKHHFWRPNVAGSVYCHGTSVSTLSRPTVRHFPCAATNGCDCFRNRREQHIVLILLVARPISVMFVVTATQEVPSASAITPIFPGAGPASDSRELGLP